MAVSLDDAALTLRIDADVLPAVSAQLSLMIAAITQEAEHAVGRAFINRPMRVTLDAFPNAIRLDKVPVASVTSVKYIDADGMLQTLDPLDYIVDAVSAPGWIVPGVGKSWPATQARINAVNVDYIAGYGAEGSAVPECAKQYILSKLDTQYEPESGANITVTKDVEYLDRLLDPLRVF